MKNLFKSLFVGTFALVMAHANADPIGGSSPCGSCYGSEITLEYAIVPDTNDTNLEVVPDNRTAG